MSKPVIFLSAAEVSGDMHAAKLIEALRRRLGEARFIGIGGPEMEAAGCEMLEHTVHRASMLLGPLKNFAYFYKLIKRLQREIRTLRPAVHVPVDSPALNWHLAKAAKSCATPVMYYVAPQVWAWAPWRIEKVRRLTDAVACLLPFEEPYLRDRGVNARFVGHPLLDRLDPPELPSIAAAFAIGQPQVALLPGSRKSEIANHAGAMAEMADRIRGLFPGARFAFAAASAESARQIQECAGRGDLPIEIGQADRVLSRSHFGLIASGTATLEAAYFGVPMVIVHRGSFLGYHVILRWMLCTRYLSLVNILANQNEFLQGHDAPDAKPLCPELMPWHGDMEQLWSAIKGLLKRPEKLTAMRRRLLDLIAPLKAPGGSAAENVAQMVIDVMRK